MHVLRSVVCAVLLLVLAVPFLAQSAQNAPTAPTEETSPQAPAESAQPAATPRVARSGRRGPCWRVAGIAPAAVNQRWQIEDQAKGKINQVCSDDSLTPDQKRDKIRQINEQTEQEIAKIIPATQLEAFKACQAQRDQEIAKRPGRTPQKELGPCGGVIPAQPLAPQHSHQSPPSNPSPQ
jgi:hypothetical protein